MKAMPKYQTPEHAKGNKIHNLGTSIFPDHGYVLSMGLIPRNREENYKELMYFQYMIIRASA